MDDMFPTTTEHTNGVYSINFITSSCLKCSWHSATHCPTMVFKVFAWSSRLQFVADYPGIICWGFREKKKRKKCNEERWRSVSCPTIVPHFDVIWVIGNLNMNEKRKLIYRLRDFKHSFSNVSKLTVRFSLKYSLQSLFNGGRSTMALHGHSEVVISMFIVSDWLRKLRCQGLLQHSPHYCGRLWGERKLFRHWWLESLWVLQLLLSRRADSLICTTRRHRTVLCHLRHPHNIWHIRLEPTGQARCGHTRLRRLLPAIPSLHTRSLLRSTRRKRHLSTWQWGEEEEAWGIFRRSSESAQDGRKNSRHR